MAKTACCFFANFMKNAIYITDAVLFEGYTLDIYCMTH